MICDAVVVQFGYTDTLPGSLLYQYLAILRVLANLYDIPLSQKPCVNRTTLSHEEGEYHSFSLTAHVKNVFSNDSNGQQSNSFEIKHLVPPPPTHCLYLVQKVIGSPCTFMKGESNVQGRDYYASRSLKMCCRSFNDHYYTSNAASLALPHCAEFQFASKKKYWLSGYLKARRERRRSHWMSADMPLREFLFKYISIKEDWSFADLCWALRRFTILIHGSR